MNFYNLSKLTCTFSREESCGKEKLNMSNDAVPNYTGFFKVCIKYIKAKGFKSSIKLQEKSFVPGIQ